MKPKWIRLFQINERCFLEEQLNRFMFEHPDSEIKVWTENGMWFAQATYSFEDAPTYSKPENEEESSPS
jgi:hypothetical protein